MPAPADSSPTKGEVNFSEDLEPGTPKPKKPSAPPAPTAPTAPTPPPSGSAGSRSRPWLCCLRRRGPPRFEQTFVVLRHSERRDYVDPSYKTSEEGLARPHDAPLTANGIKLAKEVAEELHQIHQQANFVTIACSPYRRCLETAAEVAKKLCLPIVIDQEIGEVRDRMMDEHKIAHRSPAELNALAKELNIRLVNPVIGEDGGIKIFGKAPVWPETLDDAHNRYIVRMETYIRKSAEEKQNAIVVTHADAVVAGLQMFERGGADVQDMGFCARLVAKRTVQDQADGVKGVFAEQWVVEAKAVGVDIQKENGAMGKYYEKLYLEKCDETQDMVSKRKKNRTKTDAMFDKALKDLGKKAGDEEDEDEDEDEA